MPNRIDPRSAGGEDNLDTHTGQRIQLKFQSGNLATEPKIHLPPNPLELGPEEIVIGGVPVGEPVHEDGVVGNVPVFW